MLLSTAKKIAVIFYVGWEMRGGEYCVKPGRCQVLGDGFDRRKGRGAPCGDVSSVEVG